MLYQKVYISLTVRNTLNNKIMEKYVKPQLFAQEVAEIELLAGTTLPPGPVGPGTDIDPKQGNSNGGNPVKRYSVWEDQE